MTKEEIRERLAKAKQAGDCIAAVEPGDGVVFTYELAGPNGAIFTLYREQRHTTAQIAAAKRWLYNNRDVVAIDVLIAF